LYSTRTAHTLLLVFYYFTTTTTTGAALPSVSPIDAGIRHAENAAPCIVARDVAEVMSSFLIVVPSSVTAQPSNTRSEEREREGRQDEAALRYCCAIAFLEVSEFQWLPHGAITPQYCRDNKRKVIWFSVE
jgi:hypothetical protein